MTTELKSLYEKLVNQRRDKEEKEKIIGLKYWHDEHKKLSQRVKKIRKLIESKDPSWKKDKQFLEDLLYKTDNKIADKGQSTLSEKNYRLLIKNKDFISALGELIHNPTENTHNRFDKVWQAQKESINKQSTDKFVHNAVIINRVAATCTLEVSTTVDIEKFNPVFDWLIREEMISDYFPDDSHYSEAQQWFRKNIFLMKQIKEQFQDELKSDDTDEIYLSHFVWYLYKHSKPFHAKLKIRTSR